MSSATDYSTLAGITHWLFFETIGSRAEWNAICVGFFVDNFYGLLAVSLLYLPVTFGLQRVMKNRRAFDLRIPLILWNLFMTVFSAAGAFFIYRIIYNEVWIPGHSVHWAMCETWVYTHNDLGKWAFLFNISKVIEFTDTLFIVLRKKPLIFLHYYHHLVTFLFCWYSHVHNGAFENTLGLWFVAMNFGVHAIMYGYYLCRALNVKPPIDIFITILQIAQMVGGIYFLHQSTFCSSYDVRQLYMGYLLYLSFFILFCQVFYKRYLAPKPKQKAAKGKKGKAGKPAKAQQGSAGKPAPGKAAGKKPAGKKPAGKKPEGKKPEGKKPEGKKPAGKKPKGKKPKTA